MQLLYGLSCAVLNAFSFTLPFSDRQCVDNFPYQNRCPSGLYFDDLAKYCTFKEEARCGPLPASE